MSTKSALAAIYAVSAGVIIFLFWLIYFKEPELVKLAWVDYLPYVNAAFNTLAAAFIISGIIFIKREAKKAHGVCMFLATLSSACFLVSYIIYHHYHGDTKFLAEGIIRPVYFFILITHILLSIVMVPMIFTTLYFAATKKFLSHKKIARWTYPIWIYVSITGVLIVVMLKVYNPQ
jgi:putative membrane protein